jgi:two-component system cit operon sensor histidine kinase CitA
MRPESPVPAPVELYISDRNQELLIEVADRGCGVDDAMKPHIFSRDSAVNRTA